jgi:hypothetical protein
LKKILNWLRNKRDWLFLKYSVEAWTLLIYSIPTSALGYEYETGVATLLPMQWLAVRIVYNVIRLRLARLFGKFDTTVRIFLMKESKNAVRRYFADVFSLSVYQIAIYIVSALLISLISMLMGFREIGLYQICIAAAWYVPDNLICGIIYAPILNHLLKKRSLLLGKMQLIKTVA